MTEPPDERRREEAARRTAADLARRERRAREGDTFWRSLALVGSIGWPIAGLALLGGLLGRWLGAGPVATALLVAVGAVVGTTVAMGAARRRAR